MKTRERPRRQAKPNEPGRAKTGGRPARALVISFVSVTPTNELLTRLDVDVEVDNDDVAEAVADDDDG